MGGDIGGYGAKTQSKGTKGEASSRKKSAKGIASGGNYAHWIRTALPQAFAIADPLIGNARGSAMSGAGVQQAASVRDFANYGQAGPPAGDATRAGQGASPLMGALNEAQGFQGGALGNQAMVRMYQQMMEDAAQQSGRSNRGVIAGLGGMPMPSYAQTSQQGYAQAYANLYGQALSMYLGGGM